MCHKKLLQLTHSANFVYKQVVIKPFLLNERVYGRVSWFTLRNDEQPAADIIILFKMKQNCKYGS